MERPERVVALNGPETHADKMRRLQAEIAQESRGVVTEVVASLANTAHWLVETAPLMPKPGQRDDLQRLATRIRETLDRMTALEQRS